MSPVEYEALHQFAPHWALLVTLAVPALGALAYVMQWLPGLPWVRRLALRRLGWDPGAAPEDEAARRTMLLVDQLQEEVARARSQLDRYGCDIDQLRQARLGLLSAMGELRDAAIAARTMVHALQRQAGVPETPFLPLPSPAPVLVDEGS